MTAASMRFLPQSGIQFTESIAVSAFAAPKSGGLWREVGAERGRDVHHVLRAVRFLDEDGELVSGESRDRVGRSTKLLQSVGHDPSLATTKVCCGCQVSRTRCPSGCASPAPLVSRFWAYTVILWPSPVSMRYWVLTPM